MSERFRNYLTSLSTTPLSEEQWDHIMATMRLKIFRKKQYFLQEGDICKYFGFIISGAMRQYRVDDKGVEHIIRLSVEDWWVGDRESWTMLTPSIYNIDAWENTEVLLVTKADLLRLSNAIPAYDEMVRAIIEKYTIAIQKRVNAAISMPAHMRYENFVREYPQLVQRFPQHIIASYLGITKETLSRVRKLYIKQG
jgi:Cyclic nucleotide-binding domain.